MDYTSQTQQFFKYNMNDPLRSINFAVTQNTVIFSNNKLYDLDGTGYEKQTLYYQYDITQQDFTFTQLGKSSFKITRIDGSILSLRFEQNPRLVEFRYRILAFNVILGLVGGTAGAIMSLLHLCVGWYSKFTF